MDVEAFDDIGVARGTLTSTLAAVQTAHFNSEILVNGNPDKGLVGRAESGDGDWRLEFGASGVNGAFGDRTGKWQIEVEFDRPTTVMSLLSSPTGHLTNLSAASLQPTAGQ